MVKKIKSISVSDEAHTLLISEAKALLRSEQERGHGFSTAIGISDVVRSLWYNSFDKQLNERQRTESNETLKGIFETIRRANPISVLPAWHESDYNSEILAILEKKMSMVKHNIIDGTVIAPIMVSGFIHGSYAYNIARELYPSTRFSMIGYSKLTETKKNIPSWYSGKLWMHQSDIQRLKAAKRILLVDEVIDTSQTISSIICDLSKSIENIDTSKIKVFSLY